MNRYRDIPILHALIDQYDNHLIKFNIEENVPIKLVCTIWNKDFNIYNQAIYDYVWDIAIKCPECQTENYHFNGRHFCCAYC